MSVFTHTNIVIFNIFHSFIFLIYCFILSGCIFTFNIFSKLFFIFNLLFYFEWV